MSTKIDDPSELHEKERLHEQTWLSAKDYLLGITQNTQLTKKLYMYRLKYILKSKRQNRSNFENWMTISKSFSNYLLKLHIINSFNQDCESEITANVFRHYIKYKINSFFYFLDK